MSEVKSVGALIDELYATRLTRIALEREADELKKEEARLSKFLTEELKSLDMQAVRGQTAMFSISQKVVPNVIDWPSLYEFIKENNAFTLLQKRIGVISWGEYMDSGLVVPGTEPLEVDKYSLTKAKK